MTNEIYARSVLHLRSALQSLIGRRGLVRKRSCTDLVRDIEDLKREIGRLADRMEEAERRMEDLASDAREAALEAAAELILLAIKPLRDVIRIARRLSQSSRLSRSDLADLLFLLIPMGLAAKDLFRVADDLQGISDIQSGLEEFESTASDLGQQLLNAVDEYESSGCSDDVLSS